MSAEQLLKRRMEVEQIEEGRKALELWRRWFEWSGSPWERWDELTDSCFFCGEEWPYHAKDCTFVAAKELVERAQT